MGDAVLQGRGATLLDLLDRVLDKGAVIDGKVLLSVADIDLVYLGIKVVLASVERLESPPPLLFSSPLAGCVTHVIAREWNDRSNPPHPSPACRQAGSLLKGGGEGGGEIATLPSVARNDKKGIMTQPQGEEGKPVYRQTEVRGEERPINPQKVEQGLARLVLTIVELLRRLMEKQAIRRMEGGSLTPKEMEGLGLAFKRLEERMEDLKRLFGLEGEELNLNLGPLGNLM